MRRIILLSLVSVVPVLGCIGGPTAVVNPYLTYAEEFGFSQSPTGDGTGSGSTTQVPFRQPLTITFANRNAGSEFEAGRGAEFLNTNFIAWVDLSSIRSADQQDALLRDGYVQLARQLKLGSAYSLPVGTFVYSLDNTPRANALRIGPGSQQVVTLISPDVVLVFVDPPTSCESVAFFYTEQDELIPPVPVGGPVGPWEGATAGAPYKTLAQIDVYECQPFAPGLFINLGASAQQPNEFFEGDDILFEFYRFVNAEVDGFARVSIGAQPASGTDGDSGEEP
jgi:hypothetical protein